MNQAMNDCHIQWQSEGKDVEKQAIDGECEDGLRVTIFPYAVICRQCKGHVLEQGVYVWHQLPPGDQLHLTQTQRDQARSAVAMKGGTWFLRSKWTNVNSIKSQNGTEWLRHLTKHALFNEIHPIQKN